MLFCSPRLYRVVIRVPVARSVPEAFGLYLHDSTRCAAATWLADSRTIRINEQFLLLKWPVGQSHFFAECLKHYYCTPPLYLWFLTKDQSSCAVGELLIHFSVFYYFIAGLVHRPRAAQPTKVVSRDLGNVSGFVLYVYGACFGDTGIPSRIFLR